MTVKLPFVWVMWSFSSVLATCSERMKESLCKNSVSTIEVVIKKIAILYSSICRVHSQTGDEENQWIIRKFENGLFFFWKIRKLSGNLVEYRGNQRKIFFSGKCLVGFIFGYGHFHDLKHFLLFIVMSINVPACIYVFKDVCEHSLVTCLTVLWCTITAWISVLLNGLIYTGIKKERFSGK